MLGSPLLFAPRRWAMAALAVHARFELWLLRVDRRHQARGARAGESCPTAPASSPAKHQSAWETFALIPLFRDPALLMKRELFWIPFHGWFSQKFEMIPVDRDKGPAALRRMLREAKERVADGREIIIFPEGTRRAPGAPPDYKTGVVLLYDALGVPCVPVALNSGLFWPRRSLIRRPGHDRRRIPRSDPAGAAKGRVPQAADRRPSRPPPNRLLAEAKAKEPGIRQPVNL